MVRVNGIMAIGNYFRLVNPVRNSSGALAAPAVLAHRRGRQALAQRVISNRVRELGDDDG